MKLRYAFVGIASLAFAAAPALAAENKDSDPPGFNELDQDDDGKISRTEAQRNPTLSRTFGTADGNSDGVVTRAEYLKVMASKDWNTMRQELAELVEPGSDKQAKKDDPGFNDLDTNDDGKLSKAEAAKYPALAARFAEVDGNKDGSLSRMEYLKTMAAKDFRSLREKTADLIEPDEKPKSSAGGSSAK